MIMRSCVQIILYMCACGVCVCVGGCVRTCVHVLSVCTFVGVSVLFVFMVKAVNDESLKPSGLNLMLDFCELFLCCSSSHTHIARLRSTFNILHYMKNSLNNALNLVIGVHLCCVNGQIVILAALSSGSDAG